MEYKIISKETISASMMGNSDIIQQFVQLYLMQCPIDFAALEQAVKEENPSEIKDKAHHIKPTMEYIGASALRQDFQELENMGKESASMVNIKLKFEEVKPKFELMLQELKTLI